MSSCVESTITRAHNTGLGGARVGATIGEVPRAIFYALTCPLMLAEACATGRGHGCFLMDSRVSDWICCQVGHQNPCADATAVPFKVGGYAIGLTACCFYPCCGTKERPPEGVCEILKEASKVNPLLIRCNTTAPDQYNAM